MDSSSTVYQCIIDSGFRCDSGGSFVLAVVSGGFPKSENLSLRGENTVPEMTDSQLQFLPLRNGSNNSHCSLRVVPVQLVMQLE